MVLTGESNSSNLVEIPASLAHSENSTLKLSRMSKEQTEQCLKNYTLFLVTRHPFERLLSAYRNKFLDSLPSSKYFQVRFEYKKYFIFSFFLISMLLSQIHRQHFGIVEVCYYHQDNHGFTFIVLESLWQTYHSEIP